LNFTLTIPFSLCFLQYSGSVMPCTLKLDGFVQCSKMQLVLFFSFLGHIFSQFVKSNRGLNALRHISVFHIHQAKDT
jgi:hypothetical protein